jgi:hypothetical protein
MTRRDAFTHNALFWEKAPPCGHSEITEGKGRAGFLHRESDPLSCPYSPECVEKRISRKFAVASDRTDAAVSTL